MEEALQDPALLDLALRLLEMPPIVAHGDIGVQPVLLPGRLPAEFPSEVPIPTEAELLGGCEIAGHTSACFDWHLSVGVAIAGYCKRMEANGWTELPDPPGQGSQQQEESASRRFGHPEMPTEIMVNARRLDARASRIRLSVRPQRWEPFDREKLNALREEHARHWEPILAALPELEPPPESRHDDFTESGDDKSAESILFAEPHLDLAGVADHYAAVFKRHGWTQVASDRSALVWAGRWSLTTPEGDPLSGTSILGRMSDGMYVLQVVVRTEQATT